MHSTALRPCSFVLFHPFVHLSVAVTPFCLWQPATASCKAPLALPSAPENRGCEQHGQLRPEKRAPVVRPRSEAQGKGAHKTRNVLINQLPDLPKMKLHRTAKNPCVGQTTLLMVQKSLAPISGPQAGSKVHRTFTPPKAWKIYIERSEASSLPCFF